MPFDSKATISFADDLCRWVDDVSKARGLDDPTILGGCGMAFGRIVQVMFPPEMHDKCLQLFADEAKKAARLMAGDGA